MDSVRSGGVTTPEEFESIQFRFGFMSEHRVQSPLEGSTIYQPPAGKWVFRWRSSRPGFDFPYPHVPMSSDRGTPAVGGRYVGVSHVKRNYFQWQGLVRLCIRSSRNECCLAVLWKDDSFFLWITMSTYNITKYLKWRHNRLQAELALFFRVMSLLSRRGSEDQVWLVVKSSPVFGLLLWIPPSRKMLVAVPSASSCVGNATLILCFLIPLFVTEIADTDDLQVVEEEDLHWPGEPGVMSTYFVPPSIPGDALSTASPSSLGATDVYLHGWSLVPGSLFPEHGLAREWCRHAFPPATMEALDTISYSHMANDLQYAAAQVAPHLVVAVGHLRYIGADVAKRAAVKSERDELVEKVWLLKEERHKFDKRYLMLSGEKTVVEAQEANLDGEVDLLSQQVQNLVSEKEALAKRLALRDNQFTFEVSMRKILEADLAWVLHKGVVLAVDHVVECSEFALGIHCVKAVCVAAGVGKGKTLWHNLLMQCMLPLGHFAEMDFVSYLRLGELNLVDLRQLCSNEEEHVPDGGDGGTASTQPRRG
ncbi:unnamed protein product [Lactuca saligna]|uniref:Uncharacterized protein n=1 Tax=Lactuca saligna TaxID=75948 RepID=A0AA35Z958_LACSI|nr:unnamed protein product [Lactuca saligna]